MLATLQSSQVARVLLQKNKKAYVTETSKEKRDVKRTKDLEALLIEPFREYF